MTTCDTLLHVHVLVFYSKVTHTAESFVGTGRKQYVVLVFHLLMHMGEEYLLAHSSTFVFVVWNIELVVAFQSLIFAHIAF